MVHHALPQFCPYKILFLFYFCYQMFRGIGHLSPHLSISCQNRTCNLFKKLGRCNNLIECECSLFFKQIPQRNPSDSIKIELFLNVPHALKQTDPLYTHGRRKISFMKTSHLLRKCAEQQL